MEDYAGRILAERYRLPLPPSDAYELIETRAFDTRSGQEVLVRQVPLPEVVDAELLDGTRGGPSATGGRGVPPGELPAVRRAIEAAQAAASVPDHPRLDQVFDVFAEGGSLWIVSELVPARPLAALIADEPLSPYRAAEVAADVLTALRVLHAHGWTHRNITMRTVLICEDGRVVLTGLAAGAAEDALCGYDPVPPQDGTVHSAAGSAGWPVPGGAPATGRSGAPEGGRGIGAGPVALPGAPAGGAGFATEPVTGGGYGGGGYGGGPGADAGYGAERGGGSADAAGLDGGSGAGTAAQQGAGSVQEYAPLVAPGYDTGPRYRDQISPGAPGTPSLPSASGAPGTPSTPRIPSASGTPGDRPDLTAAARAGAIAAYRAGAQAAARITEQRKAGSEPVPEQEPGSAVEPRPAGSKLPQGYSYPYGGPGSGATWHGATPRRQALPPAEPEPPARAALPAQLALPQGYHQAETPGDDTTRSSDDGQGATTAPQQPAAPGPAQPGGMPSGNDSDNGYGYGYDNSSGYGQQPPLGPGRPNADGYGQGRPGVGAPGWGSGPRSGLDAERARQTRMAVVGAVTERWAPEQAQAVHGPWQLAAPVGPATDLWGLGALLYRAVQGHAPYPEDSVAELVEMVCAEPPAFAEECGPLRPIVESLLRQDPTERPDFEELRGWLRSLVRSAPEPDGGVAMLLPAAEPDPARLPVVRRRADLHGRHRSAEHPRRSRSLGRSLLLGILVLLSGAVAYALFFMPRSADTQGGQKAAGMKPPAATQSHGRSPGPSPEPSGSGQAPSPSAPPPASKPAPQTNAPAPDGYTAQQDAEHFAINVPNGWERRGMNESGQVRYTEGDFALTVVPGRDKVAGNPDPATYQKDKEPELAPYRSSTWSSVGDIKSTKVGNQLRVTGRYTWIDGNGRSVVARNFVVALGGSYHIVLVTGPLDQEGKVTETFEQATSSYKSGG
ncbi:protein kinase [Streptomyces sp. H34-S4]|uniref:protein kinase n=1 Tax=Streptomyces sp. H34-S4 TaxID=2996463 RepID=UPI00226FC098|nr:protein kinase [Streptomyces sp. H34-S4]MCY0932904.1 serine/threonine protein kinase [Streptomyces sp. H34-S4]